MAFYISLASKLERAVRALLILQGDSAADAVNFLSNGDIFISNDSRTRTTLPNRTVVGSAVDSIKPYRPEGIVTLQIQHMLRAAATPTEADQNIQQLSVDADSFLGDTQDTMGIGGLDTDQAMSQLADAITCAGRWLAVPDPTLSGDAAAAAALIVQNNGDMANFRCDWVKRGRPFLTRGHSDAAFTTWAEVLNFECAVSYSSVALPN